MKSVCVCVRNGKVRGAQKGVKRRNDSFFIYLDA